MKENKLDTKWESVLVECFPLDFTIYVKKELQNKIEQFYSLSISYKLLPVYQRISDSNI